MSLAWTPGSKYSSTNHLLSELKLERDTYVIRTAGGRVSLRITQKALNAGGSSNLLNFVIVHHTECAAAELIRDQDCKLKKVLEATASVRQDVKFVQNQVDGGNWPKGASSPALAGWVFEMKDGLLHQLHRFYTQGKSFSVRGEIDGEFQLEILGVDKLPSFTFTKDALNVQFVQCDAAMMHILTRKIIAVKCMYELLGKYLFVWRLAHSTLDWPQIWHSYYIVLTANAYQEYKV
ncbi:hypothetical protein BDV93DRAFT_510880 [Ceratobasidium sp. AG-I]|nr:hypothetical protein BDV93DRAFT_510880 [Ceratobasidium sp. AG-I]